MIKLAVIGHPLTQSLSSVMHNAVLKELGIEGEYETLDTEQSDLVDRIKQMKSQEYMGFNVTIPLKVPITLFLDEVDEIADTEINCTVLNGGLLGSKKGVNVPNVSIKLP